MLGAQRHDKLFVGLLLTAFVQYAHVSLASIEGLAGLAQPARQSVVDQGQLQHALESLEHAHLRRAARPARRNFDFGSIAYTIGIGGWGGGLFSVRLFVRRLILILPGKTRGGGGEEKIGTESAERTILRDRVVVVIGKCRIILKECGCR